MGGFVLMERTEWEECVRYHDLMFFMDLYGLINNDCVVNRL